MAKTIALFDFDGTLVEFDSFRAFARMAVGRSAYYAALLKSVPVLMAWKLGLTSNSHAKERLFGWLFAGMTEEEFADKGRLFSIMIPARLKEDIFHELQRHVRNGTEVWIVTASIRHWVEPWAKANGVSRVIATEPEVEPLGNTLTGRFATPNCHGIEKLRRVVAELPDFAEYESFCYGDSKGDEVLLGNSTYPYKVK